MDMQLERLTIGLANAYSQAGPNNPYVAELAIKYDKNTMKVRLSSEVCARILELAGDEIAKAAQVQISAFVAQAISVSRMPMIEGKAAPAHVEGMP